VVFYVVFGYEFELSQFLHGCGRQMILVRKDGVGVRSWRSTD